MPILYDFFCKSCNLTFEGIMPNSDFKYQSCPQCGRASSKIPSFRGMVSVFNDFYSEAFEEHISTKQQLDRLQKESNTIFLRPGDEICLDKIKQERRKNAQEISQNSVTKFIQSEIAPNLESILYNPDKTINEIPEQFRQQKKG